jgi:hypothetical protein
MRKGGGMDATPEKPEGGRREERRQKGFLPDIREAIKTARVIGRSARQRGKAESGEILRFEPR